jgi:hypothetical protein
MTDWIEVEYLTAYISQVQPWNKELVERLSLRGNSLATQDTTGATTALK